MATVWVILVIILGITFAIGLCTALYMLISW